MSSRKQRRERGAQARIEPAAAQRESLALDRSMLRKVGLGLVAAKVVLVPLAFDPTAYVVFAHPKALLGHALGFVLLGVLGALGIHHGRSLLRPMPLHFAVAGVAVVSSLATLFALDRQVALYGTLDRQLGLVTLLDNVTLYFAIAILVRSRTDLLVLGAAAGTATLGLLTYAIIQRTGLDPFVWRSGIATERPFAMLGNPGNLGQFFGTVGASTAAALTTLWPRLARAWRVTVVGFLLIAISGVILSGTRAAGLGLSAAAALMAVFAINRAPGSMRLYGAATAAAVLALGLAIGAREIAGTGIDLLTGRIETREGSVSGRVDLYRVAFLEVAERPLLGVGPDNYVAGYASHRAAGSVALHESEALQTSPHSWLLKVATDAGALGLAAYSSLIAIAARLAVAKRGLSLVGLVAVVSFLGTGMVSIGDVGTEWLLWAGLALIALPTGTMATSDASSDQGGRRPSTSRRVQGARALFAWVAIALGLAASLFFFNAFDASRSAASSRQARLGTTPQIPTAILSARRSVELDSNRSEYWHELGLALAGAKTHREAEAAFRRAAELAPYQVVYLLNLAKAQIALGQESGPSKLAEALETVRRAAVTDPNVAEVQYTLALALFLNGLLDESATASERAWRIRPSASPSSFDVAVRAYRQTNRPADAERWARAAIVAHGNTMKRQLLVVQTLVEQGRLGDALAQVDAALITVPNHPDAVALREAILAASK